YKKILLKRKKNSIIISAIKNTNMDRNMYGKIDPGARQPYRTVRSKGIQPG
ncbi:hypothetical protein DOY81_007722, partial [Sarcophaga bullata]